MTLYLDYQATTPLAPEAYAAMRPWLEEKFANPHSPHKMGREAAAAVEVARAQIGALLPKGGKLYFTSGATEALNWALCCAGDVRAGLAIAATEHAAVRDTADWLASSGRALMEMPVNAAGLVDPSISLPIGTGLVATMLVNNEIGAIQPIAALADRAHAANALFLCDAVQGFGRMPIPEGPDLIAISAHKIHGPKGIGALWVRDGVPLTPLIHGGGQEGGLRSGTLSPALCAGFGAAAQLAADRMTDDAAHIARLWDIALAMLPTGWEINGSTTQRYKGNLNIRRDGLDVARLISDLRSIAFSAGSACASGSGRPSHVLRALGLSDTQARSSVRIGFGRYTTEDDLRFALNQIFVASDQQGQAFQ
jgi:cysteine desulfurase